MPTVWVRDGWRNRFHRTPECRQLRKGPARGPGQPLRELDLDEVTVRPCLTCYPDAPRVKLLKRYCTDCESKLPCEHNGGVQVHRIGTGYRQWVWPDANQMPYYRSVVQ